MENFDDSAFAEDNTQSEHFIPNFSRDIPSGKRARIIPKDDLKISDLPSTLHITINPRKWPLTKNCKISNLPVNYEKYNMQTYHFEFSHGDLRQMVNTPKVAFDRYHKNFTANGELVSKSFFILAAPQVGGMDLPVVYRLGVSRYVDDPEHYSISIHAIVGGREDGWLFLARLDNNTKNEHVIKECVQEQIQSDAVIIDDMCPAPCKNLSEKSRFHTIPYPHLHRADANCQIGVQPEKLVPLYVEKCKGKTFEQNIQYMMQLFNIQSNTMFCNQDDFMETILQNAKTKISTEQIKDPTKFVDEIASMELAHGRNVGDIDENPILKNIKRHHNKAKQHNKHGGRHH